MDKARAKAQKEALLNRSDSQEVLVSSEETCSNESCNSDGHLVVESRSLDKDMVTVYGILGTWQAKHLIKRCRGCNTGKSILVIGQTVNKYGSWLLLFPFLNL